MTPLEMKTFFTIQGQRGQRGFCSSIVYIHFTRLSRRVDPDVRFTGSSRLRSDPGPRSGVPDVAFNSSVRGPVRRVLEHCLTSCFGRMDQGMSKAKLKEYEEILPI